MAEQHLPADERTALERHVRECDRLADDLKAIERELAGEALDGSATWHLRDDGCQCLMRGGSVPAERAAFEDLL